MPEDQAKKSVLPLKVLCSCIVSQKRAGGLIFSFYNKVSIRKNFQNSMVSIPNFHEKKIIL